ncbi:MAG: hypothetical protein OEZ54_06095 [Gemmatimonadota bacterium]|nr:hypothetical protein [Gemmatimonadota bacterium]
MSIRRSFSQWFCSNKAAYGVAVLFTVGACGATPPEDFPPGLRVLFIGNSLTYTNDVPAMVNLMLLVSGAEVSEIRSIAFGGWGLPDHWDFGPARETIKDGNWDFVVMQQGPSATEGRPYLLDYAERFDGEISATGAVTSLYMVWPSLGRFFDFDGVLASYKDAAELVGGLFLPAGEAWRTAWAVDSTLQLYGPDNFHPSEYGSYLAALVIFEGITGADARTLPARLEVSGLNAVDIPVDVADVLQGAAHETVLRFGGQ